MRPSNICSNRSIRPTVTRTCQNPGTPEAKWLVEELQTRVARNTKAGDLAREEDYDLYELRAYIARAP